MTNRDSPHENLRTLVGLQRDGRYEMSFSISVAQPMQHMSSACQPQFHGNMHPTYSTTKRDSSRHKGQVTPEETHDLLSPVPFRVPKHCRNSMARTVDDLSALHLAEQRRSSREPQRMAVSVCSQLALYYPHCVSDPRIYTLITRGLGHLLLLQGMPLHWRVICKMDSHNAN